MSNLSSTNTYQERVHRAVDYISGHLSEEILLDKLANVACFSPFHFHRIFSAMLGETPRDYIERLRMELAANEICVKRNTNLIEIAYGCGFKTISSFSRTFKKFHGVTPSLFLQRHETEFHSINIMGSKKPPQNRPGDFDAIEMLKLPAFHIAYAQTLEGYETGILKAWNVLFQDKKLQEYMPTDFTLIGIPYDNPGITPHEKCRYRACITVPRQVVLSKGAVKTTNLEEAFYAVYHFSGTREDVADAYAFLFGEWLIQSGYLPDEKPLIEIYPPTLMADCSHNRLTYDIALPVVPL
jgi:AraC family transcriptional regulator